MPNSNRYLPQQIAVVASPIAFTATTGAASAAAALTTVRANIDLALAMVAYEGVEASVTRYFLDEMSPSARITLYKLLSDLKANSNP